MDPKEIALRITEDVDPSSSFESCPKCGHYMATVADGDIACINRICEHFSEPYLEAIQGMGVLGVTFGEIETVRGVVIPYVALIDKGHYYAVIVPDGRESRTWRKKRINTYKPYYPEYGEFCKQYWIWPYRPEYYGEAGMPGARGAHITEWFAKPITIKKENVARIS
jgi:hypothetical protein